MIDALSMRSIFRKFCSLEYPVSVKFITTIVALLSSNVAEGKLSTGVKKTACLSSTSHSSEMEFRQNLLLTAKRAAVGELFGELVSSATQVQDLQFTSDQLLASSVGFVRVRGNPKYYAGKGFGQWCVDITAYADPEDQRKLEDVSVTKKACLSDQNITTKELKNKVRRRAFLQALHQRDPTLKGYDPEKLLRLVHKKSYTDEGLIPDTETFCATGTGVIKPIEVIALKNTNTHSEPSHPAQAEQGRTFVGGERITPKIDEKKKSCLYERRDMNITPLQEEICVEKGNGYYLEGRHFSLIKSRKNWKISDNFSGTDGVRPFGTGRSRSVALKKHVCNLSVAKYIDDDTVIVRKSCIPQEKD